MRLIASSVLDFQIISHRITSSCRNKPTRTVDFTCIRPVITSDKLPSPPTTATTSVASVDKFAANSINSPEKVDKCMVTSIDCCSNAVLALLSYFLPLLFSRKWIYHQMNDFDIITLSNLLGENVSVNWAMYTLLFLGRQVGQKLDYFGPLPLEAMLADTG